MKERLRSSYKHLMTGVSYFLPFVVAGGVLLSFAFLFDAANSGGEDFGAGNPVSAWLLTIGGYAFDFMLPILAGFIAYSMADRPGILPGMMAGLLAREEEAGFIGAIIGAVAAGFLVRLLKWVSKNWSRSLSGVKNIVLFPVVGTLLAAAAMIPLNLVIGPFNAWMNGLLEGLSGASLVLIGAVIGGMLAADMGGPINKTAYLFAVASLTATDGSATATVIMGTAAVSGMSISTICAVASTIYRRRFSQDLRDAGKAAYVMGASYIAEGAIPFVIAKPRAVLPSIIVGAATAGALAGAFGITMSAPIGGVFTMPLASNIPLYLLSFVIGVAVGVVLLGILLRLTEGSVVAKEEAERESAISATTSEGGNS
ncbi:PTS fructose transporter subunit IIC [uncultured Agrococcus sp.]|uniref:PTS fructose transporter subunit IIC n=1 Tax=uncultured Agrococcus sp. TaxID=382258 RepID=UPI0025F60E33|nr:fructose-specific PTS transporter subunit EIIC [uncultured Agrococcus sp.]